jgi:hypothetical protein
MKKKTFFESVKSFFIGDTLPFVSSSLSSLLFPSHLLPNLNLLFSPLLSDISYDNFSTGKSNKRKREDLEDEEECKKKMV